MIALRRTNRFLLVWLLMLIHAACAAAGELPGDSLYRLGIVLVDQDSRGFHLADRRGKPQLVSMFYTSCQYVCPLIIDTLRQTQAALPPADRKDLEILLVSFDPERDTPARLNEVFVERKLDAASWTLARTEVAGVRQFAALLNIQYRALAGGDINHSSSLTLLDANGRIVARTDKIGATDPEFVAAIHRTLNAE